MLSISKQSPIPRYFQLAEAIREQIRLGLLAPGAQLPADRDLAERAGISRMTARQAVAYLVRDGLLVVKPGIGTFVAEPKLSYDALHLLGFTEESIARGDAVETEVLEQQVDQPSPRVALALGIMAGEPVVKIVRLRSVHQTPVLLGTSCLAAARVPGLERIDLARASLYGVLEERYGLRHARARQSIEATVANAFEADLFGVAQGTPLLHLEGVVSADNDEPVEYFTALYRADRIKLELESERQVGTTGKPSLSPQMHLVHQEE